MVKINGEADLKARLQVLQELRNVREESLRLRAIDLSEAIRPTRLAKDAVNDFLNLKEGSTSGFSKLASVVARFFISRAVHKESPLEYWLKEVGVNTGGVLVEKLSVLIREFLRQKKS